ncbi:DUF423 domain-containing protein [Hyphomonas johnsonii]|jgi:uncharacterized membrane protein YgdD (TMEM256/DUF423 family)|uniref:DUF423 domain-containing protein n=1 Tax=Hyphomonas johnsonii MHS-2 TaxID=1280950 RepID=A0A059FQV9_9PROT|nr:DUF423 domain-containing protein [Hyphomonas johnsonii]KCZ92863.1 hypothetical protein HJO_07907 [Hyphomonas johnsonii MHS-2]
MNRLALAAGLTGFTGVALGAFGAHGLNLDAEAAGWWQTATLYALVHAVAALAVALSDRAGLVRRGGWAFILGALVFSGCLYAMALGAPRWLGAVVPLGGLMFLAGWALVAAGATRR